MQLSPETLDRMIDAAEPVLGIPVDPAWRASIRTHLEISLRHALAITSFPLPDEAEPAPVFRA